MPLSRVDGRRALYVQEGWEECELLLWVHVHATLDFDVGAALSLEPHGEQLGGRSGVRQVAAQEIVVTMCARDHQCPTDSFGHLVAA
mmetsp:Transcript_54955/g.128518  ORF Transcript_54955/g.128518 Transcript_54955/m.128518 type:complete len:87 (-) Transcript_54955:423-683(-)